VPIVGRSEAAAVLAAAIGIAGCGGTQTPSASTHASVKRASSTSQAGPLKEFWGSPAEVASNRRLGRRGLLTHGDFPTGWTEEPEERDTSLQLPDDEVAACIHVDVALVAHSPSRVDSPRFRDSNGTEVNESVTVAPNSGVIEKYMAVFESPRTPTCLTTVIGKYMRQAVERSAAGKKLTLGTTTVAPMSFPKLGDQSIAYRIKVPARYGTTEIDTYLDAVLIREGRAKSSLDFISEGAPVGTRTEEHLASIAARRLTTIET
jgi:hypothetical protein